MYDKVNSTQRRERLLGLPAPGERLHVYMTLPVPTWLLSAPGSPSTEEVLED